MNESTFQKLSSDFLNFKGYNLIGVLGAVIFFIIIYFILLNYYSVYFNL